MGLLYPHCKSFNSIFYLDDPLFVTSASVNSKYFLVLGKGLTRFTGLSRWKIGEGGVFLTQLSELSFGAAGKIIARLKISKKEDCRKRACGSWVLLHLADEFEEVGFVERQSGVFGIK